MPKVILTPAAAPVLALQEWAPGTETHRSSAREHGLEQASYPGVDVAHYPLLGVVRQHGSHTRAAGEDKSIELAVLDAADVAHAPARDARRLDQRPARGSLGIGSSGQVVDHPSLQAIRSHGHRPTSHTLEPVQGEDSFI